MGQSIGGYFRVIYINVGVGMDYYYDCDYDGLFL